jgi:hypothetical protein
LYGFLLNFVNNKYAPVNARGHVEYSMDITILKPVDKSILAPA